MPKVNKLDLGTQIESPVDQIQHGGSTYDPNKKAVEDGIENDSLQGSDGASPFLAGESETSSDDRILAALENLNARLDRIEAELSSLKNRQPSSPTRYITPSPVPTWPLGPDDPREYYIGDVPNSPLEVGDTPETTSPLWKMPPVVTARCDLENGIHVGGNSCCGAIPPRKNANQASEITFGSKEEAGRFFDTCSGSSTIGTPKYLAARKLLYGF